MLKKFMCITTYGLEECALSEALRDLPIKHQSSSYRKIFFDSECDISSLNNLKCIDSGYIYLGDLDNLKGHKTDLEIFNSNKLSFLLRKLSVAVNLIEVENPKEISITVNFVGKRTYTTINVKSAISDYLLASKMFKSTGDDDGSRYNLRVFIEHSNVYFGLRTSNIPLWKRDYKKNHIEGSLRSTIAASMIQIVSDGSINNNLTLVDPCCGAGTIITEALNVGFNGIGYDINQEAIEAAIANSNEPNAFKTLSFQEIVLPKNSVDYVVSNPPWGKKVAIDYDLPTFYSKLLSKIHYMLKKDGKVCILCNDTNLLQSELFEIEKQIFISLSGETPAITVLKPL